MFSDGYADQFGGPKGKKFKYKNLISLLENNSDNSTEHQHKNISENFDNWKGQLEQLDDVLLFGMKV
jgi:ribosomal protein L9